ncbi:MAG TPA: glycosyl hydrolase family 28 protein [Prolixibacteraceae bacterium]|nr:glycosyl hydrolase family 28 protein [Prolixibacteraceae bacterium]
MNLNKIYSKFLFLLILFPVFGFGQQKQINIADLGAKGDGKTDNTLIIQKAIDEASASDNGKVIVPSGTFLTGVIHIKSNVEIHLAENAIWLGSAKRIDYGPKDASPLIVAKGEHNFSITGKGTIDGNGKELIKDIYVMLNAGTLKDTEWQVYNPWHQMRPEERNRPKIILFQNCDSIQVKGITIKNGLMWVQDYRSCTNVTIDSIKVRSTTFLNNDGIDITDSKNVRITNCDIDCADDGICLKSSLRNEGCENIYVANCSVRSSASAIKLGTASHGGFKNITIRDIQVHDTYRSAIAIESVDGGILEDIDVRNISAKNTGNAICIRLGHRNTDSVYSQLRNVHIAHMRVEIPTTKPDKGYEEEGPLVSGPHNVFPSSVTGIPGHPVENVTIEDIELIYEGGGNTQVACMPFDSLSKIPELISGYPEFSMFGELPAWGFFARHVEGLIMKNITVKTLKKDYRPAFIFDDVNDLKLKKLNIYEDDNDKQFILRNSKGDLNDIDPEILKYID